MKRSPEMPINLFQLAILLNEQERKDYQFHLAEGVFCSHC
jgi:hypothetical protein